MKKWFKVGIIVVVVEAGVYLVGYAAGLVLGKVVMKAIDED